MDEMFNLWVILFGGLILKFCVIGVFFLCGDVLIYVNKEGIILVFSLFLLVRVFLMLFGLKCFEYIFVVLVILKYFFLFFFIVCSYFFFN